MPGTPNTLYANLDTQKREDALLALGQYFQTALAVFLRIEGESSVDGQPVPFYAEDKGRVFLENST